MSLIASFVIFIGAMILCISLGYTMVIALFIGLAAFVMTGRRKGFRLKELAGMGLCGVKDALVVVEVMFIIGFITAVWRSSGTIAFFVYYGIKMITPSLFLIVTFVLSCLLSYALGTSFGVAGTVGVIFITLARSGGVNDVITAAVVMSGIYFGDRGSPVSSSAILVATITRTDLLGNVRTMMKTGLVPLLLTFGIYCVFSFANPIHTVDQAFLYALRDEFRISLWCVLPAVCMLFLPLLKVPVVWAMGASIGAGVLVSLFVQGEAFPSLLHTMVFGYASQGTLGPIINGGGLSSMIEVVFIVALSSTYSGIFSGTDMLKPLQEKIVPVMERAGRFAGMVLVSLATLCIFCNQTIASMMCCDLLKKPYEAAGASREELAMDLENSVIVLAGAVPWAIACSVPLGFMQAGISAVPLSFFLFLVPLCYGIQKKVANPFAAE